MKTIGFIDYYLSEWHANNYPAWFSQLGGEEFRIAYAWAELDRSPLDGVTTEEWCAKFGATPCAAMEELCEKADYLLILAPSNPEKHLEYAKVALTYGKATYIDKSFATSIGDAREMFRIASENGTPLFSSSALRYADEIAEYGGKGGVMTVTAGGSNLPEYIIHPLEMVVRTMGTGAEGLYLTREGEVTRISVRYPDDRFAQICYNPKLPYSFTLTDGKGGAVSAPVKSAFFMGLLADILRFYREGEASFATEETDEVIRLREVAVAAEKMTERWIDLRF